LLCFNLRNLCNLWIMSLTTRLQRYESLLSTNSELARLALEGAAEGLCIIADEQTAGRGRLQRQWLSPRDSGLYFSILLKPEIELRVWPLITLMAAVAVHDALSEICRVDFDIKWPNDITIRDKKVCGILAETIETHDGRAVVLGIGINLAHTALPELSEIAISIEEATGMIVDREVMIQTLIEKLTEYYELLQTRRDAQILDEWCRRSTYAGGKLIRVSAGDEVIHGFTRGLEADGALRVETVEGQIKVVRAGDVTEVRQKSK
jgi:BirA family transcriptional regulator, biotin operon repressor / biotin---[acetyl-CoA-carboxylase] ligase